MKSIKSTDLERILLNKGFRKKEGSNHSLCFLYSNGKKTSIKVPISRGKKEYAGSLLNQVKKQMKLEKQDFEDFLLCDLSEEDYLKKLRGRNLVD